MLNIEMTIWDNTTCTAEKNDVLRYCERALIKTWAEWYGDPAPIMLEQRTWYGFIAKVPLSDADETYAFLARYNQRLNRLHYWHRLNTGRGECLIMEYKAR